MNWARPFFRLSAQPRRDSAGAARRRAPRISRFGMALCLSTVLHLSMVTVFKIVIYFPREDIHFYQFELIPDRSVRPVGSATASVAPDRLRVPSLDDVLELEDAATPGADRFQLSNRMLPEIALPTVEFAELERLRVRQRGVESSPLYQEIFQESHPDSWSRFGQRLRRVGQALGAGGDFDWDDSTPLSAQLGVGEQQDTQRMPAGRPAEGFEAYIEWATEPRDRTLLYAPPIQALWQLDPARMQRQIEVVFEVNPHGRVISAWSPGMEDTEVLDAVQAALFKYRFSSIEDSHNADQLATLIIRRERPEGAAS